MAIKKTLTGWDFCECPPCEERSNEVYPTTSDDQVIIDELGSNLATWLNIGRDGTYYTSLYSWLQANYPNSSYTLPVATDSTLGGVIVDTTNLTISNDGVLSVNVSSLNIPSVGTATFSASGTVKLGNSTTLTSNFVDATISGQVHDDYSYSGHVYAFPLRLDVQGRAGVVVPTDLFAVNQSKAASTWTFDWSKKVTNVSIGTPTSGVETNYILLGNRNVNTSNGELGYDDNGRLSTSCGYPRLALVAGDNITMTRYTNTFIPQADNYWGGNITEILISATDTTYQPFTGADGTHAGEAGLVPTPLATDNLKYLKGNGTWSLISYNELTDKPSFATFMIYKGTVDNYAALRNIYNPEIGWVYNVLSTGMNYAWDGIAWDALGTSFSIDTLSTTEHSSNTSYAIKGSGYIGTATKFLKEDGSWSTPTDTTYSAATANDLGLIKIGYTRDGNKKPVQLDANNKAYVDTEQHPTVGGMVTGGLSAHFFRVGTGSSAGSFTADKWIPIIISHSTNIGKCSVSFEIFGREDGKTSYGKYYANHMTNKTNSLLCTSFYSEDTNHFDYSDVRCAKYAASDNDVTIIIYKKVRNVTDSMFIVNILAENSESYSIQHYFYTGASSIADINYKLINSDLRIGTYNNSDSTITARLENDGESTEITMSTIGATNATFYNPQ